MQITLSSQQSQILESLSQQGGYSSIEDAIDIALVLLADEIIQQSSGGSISRQFVTSLPTIK